MSARGISALVAALLLGLSCAGGTSSDPSILAGDGGNFPPLGEVTGGDQYVAPDLGNEGCQKDEQCGDYFCDKQGGQCVECLINSHCPTGYSCVEHQCKKDPDGCESDAECSADEKVCDLEKGKCVWCLEHSQCSTGHYCLDGKCLPWVCTPDSAWCIQTVSHRCNEFGNAELAPLECADGDVCTVGDGCANGECKETSEADCDDDNPCTDDSCLPDSGCVVDYNEDACDDGTNCTLDDQCKNGVCVPGELVCDCVSDENCLPQEDEDLCNGVLHCIDGFCIVNPDTVVECQQPQDSCKSIECVPETGVCKETNVPEETECDDDDGCTQDDLCIEGQCIGQPVVCDDSNPCTSDACDQEEGCLFTPKNDDACDDGDECTWPDYCVDGLCFGDTIDCEDGNPCTKNTCVPLEGCQMEELEGACEDGDQCTTGDTCIDTVCTGTDLTCEDDNNFCTTDYCDSAIGCVYEPNDFPCDDGNPCTSGDICTAGECVPGENLYDCNDENPCTNDSCNIDTGECLYIPNTLPCEDGDLCTKGDVCTNSVCTPGDVPDCDDNNGCTEDSCNDQGNCVNAPLGGPCDNGNPCTTGDQCLGGLCQPGNALLCNDSNGCTDDGCDPEEGGCVFVPNSKPCDDGSVCTQTDVCAEGQCVGTNELDCVDTSPCTNDYCHENGGCQHIPITGDCDDGDPCTKNDYCAVGICLSGPPVTCDDESICTNDSCNPDIGCVYTPNSKPCDDGNPCTFGDVCYDGACQAGDLTDCGDDNPCTEDSCENDACVYAFADGSCDDENPCTVEDVCFNGNCAGDQVANCGCHSLQLDGLNGRAKIGYQSHMALAGAFTVETWFKPLSSGTYNLVSRWQDSGRTDHIFRLSVLQGQSMAFMMKTDEGASCIVEHQPAGLMGWHHLAAVYTGEHLQLYVDGVMSGSVNCSGNMVNSSKPLFFGVSSGAGDGDNDAGFYAGYLDEIRISSAAIYAGADFVPEAHLTALESTVGYWGADQNQFNTLFDTSDNAMHAVLKGGASWSDDTPADVCVPVPNFPPSIPGVSVQPPNPVDSDTLTCVIDQPSQDMENDPITYTYKWYKNGVSQPAITGNSVGAGLTNDCPNWNCAGCEKWLCKAIPSDGSAGVAGSASATVGLSQCEECSGQVWGGHCYEHHGSQDVWDQGQNVCSNWGGHLVAITSESENSFINGLCGNCWIGMSDKSNEGSWVWVSSEAPAWGNWRWDEPAVIGSGSKDCAYMCQDCGLWQDSGQWISSKCDASRNYVCEKAPQ